VAGPDRRREDVAVTVAEDRPEDVARAVARKAADTADDVAARLGSRPTVPRAAEQVLADVVSVWPAERGPLSSPAPSMPFIWLPVDPGGGRLGRPRAAPAGISFVAGSWSIRAALQVLLVRPNETVVAVSRRATAAEIARGVKQLRDEVLRWTRAGDGSEFPKSPGDHPLRERADYWLPRSSWELTASGLVSVPEAAPPVVATSAATVLTLPGPGIGDVVSTRWLEFQDETRAYQPGPRTALGVRLAEDWAWAAVDGMIDVVGQAAARLSQDATVGDEVNDRYRAVSDDLGYGRNNALRQIRPALSDPRRVLPDDPYKSLWHRLGIRAVSSEEQDTLVFGLARGRSLRVELVPIWSAEGEPPARAHLAGDRLVIDVNVAAEATEVEFQVWSSMAAGIAQADLIRSGPATSNDLLRESDPELDRRAAERLAGLTERCARAGEFARWLTSKVPG
jgi:hypothetical protein